MRIEIGKVTIGEFMRAAAAIEGAPKRHPQDVPAGLMLKPVASCGKLPDSMPVSRREKAPKKWHEKLATSPALDHQRQWEIANDR